MPTLGSDSSESESCLSDNDEDIPIYLLAGINVSEVKSSDIKKNFAKRKTPRNNAKKTFKFGI